MNNTITYILITVSSIAIFGCDPYSIDVGEGSRFDNLDSNDDSSISRIEWEVFYPNIDIASADVIEFEMMDCERDGLISQDEYIEGKRNLSNCNNGEVFYFKNNLSYIESIGQLSIFTQEQLDAIKSSVPYRSAYEQYMRTLPLNRKEFDMNDDQLGGIFLNCESSYIDNTLIMNRLGFEEHSTTLCKFTNNNIDEMVSSLIIEVLQTTEESESSFVLVKPMPIQSGETIDLFFISTVKPEELRVLIHAAKGF